MCRKKQNDFVSFIRWKFLKFIIYPVSECFDEQVVSWPSINHTPLDVIVRLLPFEMCKNWVEARAWRGTRILRILREDYDSLRVVLFNLLNCIFGEGMNVAKANVTLVRCSLRWNLIQLLAHEFALKFCPFENWRATANFRVFLLNLRCTSFGDPRT